MTLSLPVLLSPTCAFKSPITSETVFWNCFYCRLQTLIEVILHFLFCIFYYGQVRRQLVEEYSTGSGVHSVLGQPPPIDAQEDSSTVMCQRLLCRLNDIDCLLNKTKSIQWEFIALPTIPYLNLPVTLLQLRSVGSSVYPDIRFMIISGNDDGFFEVTNHHSKGYEAGRLLLMKPIFGPATYMFMLRMDNRNRYNYIISTHYAIVTVIVSGYRF
ncbi:hypothetical protein LSAT2_000501 [Lamellibrachia satsuma]|nr:hypothetical protein LSAT2_000501 [Lamellibrachia satsuma]